MPAATETDSLLLTASNNNGTSTTDGASAQTNNSNQNHHCLWLVGILCLLVGMGVGVAFSTRFDLLVVVTPRAKSASQDTVKANSKSSKSKRNSPYTATQFISFSINTLGGMAEYGECEGRTVDPEDGLCYLGNADNLQDDLDHRFAIIEEVLLTLREDFLNENPEVDHSPHVLKIFMLPEFYLRGPNGAYSSKQLGKDGLLIQLGDKLHTLLNHPEFEDWLFVLGTVIVSESPHHPDLPWDYDSNVDIEKGDILYFNFAPIYRGGSHVLQERYWVPKQYISGADFLNRANGLPDPRQHHLTEYDNSRAIDQQVLDFLLDDRNLTLIRDNVLDIDGVRIGIEICLDHRLGVLWKKLQQNGGDLVDVQLITSAGMAIERGPNPLKPGGVVYLTDGEASSAACMRDLVGDDNDDEFDPFHVCRGHHNDGPTGLKHVPIGTKQGYSSFIELATCLNPDDAPWKPLMEGYYSNHATQGCAYTLKLHGIDVFDEYDFYPPSIEIYPTIDLPEL